MQSNLINVTVFNLLRFVIIYLEDKHTTTAEIQSVNKVGTEWCFPLATNQLSIATVNHTLGDNFKWSWQQEMFD